MTKKRSLKDQWKTWPDETGRPVYWRPASREDVPENNVWTYISIIGLIILVIWAAGNIDLSGFWPGD